MIWQRNISKAHLYTDLVESLQLGTYQVAEFLHFTN